jgi:hypothetical protein
MIDVSVSYAIGHSRVVRLKSCGIGADNTGFIVRPKVVIPDRINGFIQEIH